MKGTLKIHKLVAQASLQFNSDIKHEEIVKKLI